MFHRPLPARISPIDHLDTCSMGARHLYADVCVCVAERTSKQERKREDSACMCFRRCFAQLSKSFRVFLFRREIIFKNRSVWIGTQIRSELIIVYVTPVAYTQCTHANTWSLQMKQQFDDRLFISFGWWASEPYFLLLHFVRCPLLISYCAVRICVSVEDETDIILQFNSRRITGENLTENLIDIRQYSWSSPCDDFNVCKQPQRKRTPSNCSGSNIYFRRIHWAEEADEVLSFEIPE